MVYVTGQAGNNVTPITVATNAPGTAIGAGGEPMGIAITPTARPLVGSYAGTLTPIKLSTNTAGRPSRPAPARWGGVAREPRRGRPPAEAPAGPTDRGDHPRLQRANSLTLVNRPAAPNATLVSRRCPPRGTTVTIYMGNESVLGSKLPGGQTFMTSFSVSWAAPDGSSPDATGPSPHDQRPADQHRSLLTRRRRAA